MNYKSPVWGLVSDIAKKGGITELSINGPKNVFVERAGKYIQVNATFTDVDLNLFIEEISDYNQKECNKDNPILDGNLPDGSRVNIICPPFVHGSPAISIRRYLKLAANFKDSPDIFGLNPKWIRFLKSLMKARMNVVVSGGTGVGKTTFMNLMLAEINAQDRVVTIEDTLELNLLVPNLVRLESGGKSRLSGIKLEVRDLVKNTLRMRPDRIIIGETRGGELFDLLQAMNTGHEGSMTSIHSNSCGECLSRMETLFLMAGFEIPLSVVRRQISSAVDFIIQLGREEDGKRVIQEITELNGMEGSVILASTIAKRSDGELRFLGIPPKRIDKLFRDGDLPTNFFEIF